MFSYSDLNIDYSFTAKFDFRTWPTEKLNLTCGTYNQKPWHWDRQPENTNISDPPTLQLTIGTCWTWQVGPRLAKKATAQK
jgi:hypothetical protein